MKLYLINENLIGMSCINCSTRFEVDDFFSGCPKCLSIGQPSSVSFLYNSFRINEDEEKLFKYTSMLPYTTYPRLGEGYTPTIKLNKLGKELEVEDLWIKNEGQNPTGSHKDRMSPFVIARAKSLGIQTVAVASSGNAGASISAYAAAEGLECIVLTTESMNPIWKQAIERTNSKIIYKENSMDRWKHMKSMVDRGEWYPATNFENPPVGSNPFGVQGYKSIAYEIIEDFEELPNVIIVPCSRGDLLWGIWEGFREAFHAKFISEIPKLIAVEPFPRLKRALEGEPYINSFTGDSTDTPSIAGTTVTYQALHAIQETKGDVIVISQQHAKLEQQHLGNHGVYAERSSALVLGALKNMIRSKKINKTDKVLLIISSNGYKELL